MLLPLQQTINSHTNTFHGQLLHLRLLIQKEELLHLMRLEQKPLHLILLFYTMSDCIAGTLQHYTKD
jgi:hypothetical protein